MIAQDRPTTGSLTRPATGVCLAGTGIGVPQRVMTNADLAGQVETNDEWITKRTGIRQRRIADENETVRSMASEALGQALGEAKLEPSELDMVICATLTPEMGCPSTAARVVADIGAVPAGAVDISAACSGFVYGLNQAWALINSGMCRNVGVVGVEKLSGIVDWEDRRTCVLFGDGAGAAVLSACDDTQRGCLHQAMHSDGSKWDMLYLPETQADLPEESNGFSGKFHTLQMNGREVYKFAVTTLQACIENTLKACDLKADDLAMIIPHQSNSRILESAREKLGLAEDRLYINIDRYGNTSAASVPICLHELMSEKRLKQGDLVLFVALGGGLTWSSSLWRL